MDDVKAETTTGGAVGPSDVVGHKTFSDGKGGHYHEPLTRAEADAMWAAAEAATKKREADMPDEQAALRQLFDAYTRLRDFGWREQIYMPKDGRVVHLIEAGSTGIHEGYYMETPTRGSAWVMAEGDLWPSHPILFRERSTTPTPSADTDATRPTAREAQNKES